MNILQEVEGRLGSKDSIVGNIQDSDISIVDVVSHVFVSEWVGLLGSGFNAVND